MSKKLYKLPCSVKGCKNIVERRINIQKGGKIAKCFQCKQVAIIEHRAQVILGIQLTVCKDIEAAFDKFHRHQCGDGMGHEFVDTCDFYRFIQRYRRKLSMPIPSRHLTTYGNIKV